MEIGKLYMSHGRVVMATGDGDSKYTFAGVVVQTASKHVFPVGMYSDTWTRKVFAEYKHLVIMGPAPKDPETKRSLTDMLRL